MRSLQVGEYTVTVLPDSLNPIEGERVLYPAPIEVWRDKYMPNDEGIVMTAITGILIAGNNQYTLVDTGFGEEHRDPQGKLLESLAEIGVDPGQIGRVVMTHSHGDHFLGNTVLREGQRVATYPNAEYVIQESDLERVRSAQEEAWAKRFAPLVDSGQLRTIEGRCALDGAITCWPTPGHTIGHQCVLVEDQGQSALVMGDLAIYSLGMAHTEWGPNWSWSREADEQSRREVADWACDTGATLILGHDPYDPLIRMEREGDHYRVVPVAP